MIFGVFWGKNANFGQKIPHFWPSLRTFEGSRSHGSGRNGLKIFSEVRYGGGFTGLNLWRGMSDILEKIADSLFFFPLPPLFDHPPYKIA